MPGFILIGEKSAKLKDLDIFTETFNSLGLPLEKVLRNILRTRFLYPMVRPYKTENFYALLSGFKKEAKPIAEPDKKKKHHSKKA